MSQGHNVSPTEERPAGDDRPSFVNREALEMPFATPVVASYDLDGLGVGSASALTPNGRTDTHE